LLSIKSSISFSVDGIPAVNISISPLDSQRSQAISVPLNTSALIEFNKQLNIQANVRDYLISFTTNLVIAGSNSIILQASSLAQLTQATNELTRTTSVNKIVTSLDLKKSFFQLIASNKCYQLAIALYSISNQIPYEDVLTAATQISQCTNNIMSVRIFFLIIIRNILNNKIGY